VGVFHRHCQTLVLPCDEMRTSRSLQQTRRSILQILMPTPTVSALQTQRSPGDQERLAACCWCVAGAAACAYFVYYAILWPSPTGGPQAWRRTIQLRADVSKWTRTCWTIATSHSVVVEVVVEEGASSSALSTTKKLHPSRCESQQGWGVSMSAAPRLLHRSDPPQRSPTLPVALKTTAQRRRRLPSLVAGDGGGGSGNSHCRRLRFPTYGVESCDSRRTCRAPPRMGL
jgi:hypothetical protein